MRTLEPRRLARSRWAIVAVLAVTALLYTCRLGDAPIAVANDEAHFAAHAYAMATTGRDLNGVRLPLFVEMIDPLLPDVPGTARWQPFLFYLTSISLLIFPMSEWAIRLPVVLVGLISIALIYAVVLDSFKSRGLATASAILMALTPSLFIMSRQAIDYLCPVPFVLGWLWCLGRFLQGGSRRYLTAAGAILGVGALSHISGWALAPLFAVVTMATLAQRRMLRPRTVAAFALGALVPIIVVGTWLWFHPGVTRELVERYGLIGDESTRHAPGPQAPFIKRLSIYWDFFSPSFLFFAGGAHPTQATSRAGVFLLPLALLMPLGLLACRSRPRALTPAIVWGFLAAPLPVVAVMGVMSEYSIGRTMMLVPFGILLGAHGMEWLWARGRRGQAVLAALFVMVPLQFSGFLSEYFGDYQVRAAARFDALNTKAVAAFAMDYDTRTPVPAIYLSDDDRDSKAVRWRFHLWKHHREDLWSRTRYYYAVDVAHDEVPAGSLLVFFPGDSRVTALLGTGRYVMLATMTHPSGDAASVILLRP